MRRFIIIVYVSLSTTLFAQQGTLDVSFGVDGKRIVDIDEVDRMVGVLSDENHNTYFYGHTSNFQGGSILYDIVVGKVDQFGILDPAFGTNGVFRMDFPLSTVSTLQKAIFDSTGIYFIGLGTDPNTSDTNRIFIGKITLDGQLDNSFGSSGFVTSNFLGKYNVPGSIIMDSQRKIVFAGTTDGDTYNRDMPLVGRLNLDGTPDLTFGNTGYVAWDYLMGDVIDAINEHEEGIRHTDGGYLSEIVETEYGYISCGYFSNGGSTKLLVLALTPLGEVNLNFGGAGYLVIEPDPTYNHFVNDATYYNDQLIIAFESDGPQYGTSYNLQVIDTNGILEPVHQYEAIDKTRKVKSIAPYQGRLYLSGHSKPTTNTTPGYLSEEFRMTTLDNNFNQNTDFGSNGYFVDSLSHNNSQGIESIAFHLNRAILGGHSNNEGSNNYIDFALMAVHLANGVSINEEELKHPIVFPNPTQGILYMNSHLTTMEASLYSISGQLLRHWNKVPPQIDISTLDGGVYLLSITQNGERSIQRIIKE